MNGHLANERLSFIFNFLLFSFVSILLLALAHFLITAPIRVDCNRIKEKIYCVMYFSSLSVLPQAVVMFLRETIEWNSLSFSCCFDDDAQCPPSGRPCQLLLIVVTSNHHSVARDKYRKYICRSRLLQPPVSIYFKTNTHRKSTQSSLLCYCFLCAQCFVLF